MSKVTITLQEKEKFDYLNNLRLSGVVNMFMAGPYLMADFDISSDDASEVLKKWMALFNEDGYADLVE